MDDRESSRIASSRTALSFLNDVLESGETDVAQDILAILIVGCDEAAERQELKKWSKAIAEGRKRALKILKEKMQTK